MSMLGSAGAGSVCDAMIKFIAPANIEAKLGLPLTEQDKELLGHVLAELLEIKKAADSGWW